MRGTCNEEVLYEKNSIFNKRKKIYSRQVTCQISTGVPLRQSPRTEMKAQQNTKNLVYCLLATTPPILDSAHSFSF